MKLSRNQVENILKAYLTREKECKKGASSQEGSSASSPKARRMGVLKKRLRKIPTTRQELVEAIQKYLERGQYHPGGMEVAKKTLYRALVDFVIGKEEGSGQSE